MINDKYWVTRSSTPLLKEPDARADKVCDLPFGTVVYSMTGFQNNFGHVQYVASKTFEGWMYYADAEPIRYILAHDVVNMSGLQTNSEQDAAQYVIYLNNTQYNLCGELCVCSIFNVGLLNDNDNQKFLTEWKSRPTSWFNKVFLGGKARTTGVSDLVDMASGYLCQIKPLKDAFYDEYHKSVTYSPRRMAYWTYSDWQIILGVKIETRFGSLRSSGVGHWVVVRKIEPNGVNRALVTIYNPFTNNEEQYSWNELVQSMGSVPYGILVRNMMRNSSSVNMYDAHIGKFA